MKIIIIGAGELGKLLAERLCRTGHTVTIIDPMHSEFAQLHQKLDVMTIGGEATNSRVMKQAGIQNADLCIAVSGNQEANILACQIAGHFKVPRNICRLYSTDFLSPDDGLTADFFGIDKTFSSPKECAQRISDVLNHPCVLERVHFSSSDATMVAANITNSSPLNGMKISEIPCTDILGKIRIAAIVRQNSLMVPHGDTVLKSNDRIYIAGRTENVDDFLSYIGGPVSRASQRLVVIAGATLLGGLIAEKCLESGMKVRLIDSSRERCEALLSRLPEGMLTVRGSTNDEDILTEAQVQKCDVFVSAQDDDESSILSCVLAKRLGAKKVVAVTHKPEYIDIVPAMENIDCDFNSTLVSANAVFRLMDQGIIRIDSHLKAANAYLSEFTIDEKSRLCGQQIKDCQLPNSLVLALLMRDDDVIAPTGTTFLRAGDRVAAILTGESEEQLAAFIK